MTEINVEETSRPRMYFFDNLKGFIILLMVVFHVAMGYTTWDLKWWYVNDIYKSMFFDLFILETDVYIMPIMFLIAGFFAAAALPKKTLTLFWQAKFRRIVLPWIGGVLLIAPLIAYSAIFSRTDTAPNYFTFLFKDFWGAYYQQAHYWFLGILSLFFSLLTIGYQLNPAYFKKPPQITKPPMWLFPSFALLTAALFFIANLFFWNDLWVNAKFIFMIQPVRIGVYLCYFCLGVYAWKNSWFSPKGYRPRLMPWGLAAMIMSFVFLAYRITFTFPPVTTVLVKAGHALTFAVFCLTVTFALIAFFQKFADSDHYIWRRLAANSYTIYFIHQCIVIPLAYLVQTLQINVFVKYFGVAVSSVILCFLISEYIISPVLSPQKKESAFPPIQ